LQSQFSSCDKDAFLKSVIGYTLFFSLKAGNYENPASAAGLVFFL